MNQRSFQCSLRAAAVVSAFTLNLAACSNPPADQSNSTTVASNGTPAGTQSANKADIVAAESGNVSLGNRWYPFESSAGQSFRWVDEGAEIVVHKPHTKLVTLTIDLEAGPGLGTTDFPLLVLDGANRQIAGVFVKGRTTVNPVVPAVPEGDNVYRLQVPNGGHHAGNDKRTLNFRVFSVGDGVHPGTPGASGPDIALGAITIGTKGWYPLEHFRNDTFRWVSNDAEFTTTSSAAHNGSVIALVEPGPGVGSPRATISLLDGSGKVIGSQTAIGKSAVTFNAPFAAGANAFRLHVAGGGKKAPQDARTLNFRVFRLSAN